eukprot:PhM_4_TR15525/c0_g1_i1/m.25219
MWLRTFSGSRMAISPMLSASMLCVFSSDVSQSPTSTGRRESKMALTSASSGSATIASRTARMSTYVWLGDDLTLLMSCMMSVVHLPSVVEAAILTSSEAESSLALTTERMEGRDAAGRTRRRPTSPMHCRPMISSASVLLPIIFSRLASVVDFCLSAACETTAPIRRAALAMTVLLCTALAASISLPQMSSNLSFSSRKRVSRNCSMDSSECPCSNGLRTSWKAFATSSVLTAPFVLGMVTTHSCSARCARLRSPSETSGTVSLMTTSYFSGLMRLLLTRSERSAAMECWRRMTSTWRRNGARESM